MITVDWIIENKQHIEVKLASIYLKCKTSEEVILLRDKLKKLVDEQAEIALDDIRIEKENM